MKSYSELLESDEWQKLRTNQFFAAGYTCKMCSIKVNWDIDTKEFGYYAYVLTETTDKFGFPTMESNLEKLENPVVLHLHHTYYVKNTLPWDYPDICFEVLCEACHKEVHSKKKILMYASHTLGQNQHLTPCERCLGTGYLQEFHYYMNGVCFLCEGAGFEELKENRFPYLQKNNQNDNLDPSHPPVMNEDTDDYDLPF